MHCRWTFIRSKVQSGDIHTEHVFDAARMCGTKDVYRMSPDLPFSEDGDLLLGAWLPGAPNAEPFATHRSCRRR
jgi:hypothetical protein